jgi:hypothetical protein
MFDWLITGIGQLGAWMETHPSAIAWALGWLAALGATQTIKALIIPATWSGDRVKRVTQLIAMAVGSTVAFILWPPGPHRLLLAVIVGMSAPTAYTFFKACIEARFPDLARAMSWAGVQSRRGDDQPTCTRNES